MDMWASLEHQIRYKKESRDLSEDVEGKLFECAKLSESIDQMMQEVHNEVLEI